MNVKKLGAFALIIAMLLGGCSGRGGTDVALDIDSAAQTIVDSVAFRNQLTKADETVASNNYMLDESVAGYAIYIDGSGGSAEEVAVLEAASEDDVQKVRQIVDTRLNYLKGRFENYVPEEMTKINDPVIETRGRYVILVLADDARDAGDVVAGLFK